MHIVIDTNILVSALWSKNGTPAQIMGMIVGGALTSCYDYRILSEYAQVLHRPKFHFFDKEINALLEWIEASGLSVIAEPIYEKFTDEADKKNYEVAKFCNAKLITGNAKHFPPDDFIFTPAKFLEEYGVKGIDF